MTKRAGEPIKLAGPLRVCLCRANRQWRGAAGRTRSWPAVQGFLSLFRLLFVTAFVFPVAACVFFYAPKESFVALLGFYLGEKGAFIVVLSGFVGFSVIFDHLSGGKAYLCENNSQTDRNEKPAPCPFCRSRIDVMRRPRRGHDASRPARRFDCSSRHPHGHERLYVRGYSL